MGKKISYNEMKKNKSLDNFTQSGTRCPECGAELDCDDDNGCNIVMVCSACGWKNY